MLTEVMISLAAGILMGALYFGHLRRSLFKRGLSQAFLFRFLLLGAAIVLVMQGSGVKGMSCLAGLILGRNLLLLRGRKENWS